MARRFVPSQEFLVAFPNLKECTIAAYAYKPIRKSEVAVFVERLRTLRLKAKAEGNLFLADSLKLILNSLYGKYAQSLSKKRIINLKNSTVGKLIYMEMQPSKITNPLIASFVTGCVRAEIAEYLHYCDTHNIKLGQVATDGFITFQKLGEECLKGVGYFTKYLSQQLGNDNLLELDQEHSGEGFLGIKNRAYTILKSEKGFCKITGISFIGKTDEEKRDFVIHECLNLHLFKNTRYKQKTLPANAKWLRLVVTL